jgi:hypothetical protein
MKQLLQSFGIGFLIILALWGIGMLSSMSRGFFESIGFVIAAIIGYPFIKLYGADPKTPPPLFVSIAIYLSEATIVGLFVYLIFFRNK